MLLEASHVTTSFGAQDVLRDASFRLTDGERVGLVGKNGIGKTTLLRILASEAPPDRGHVRRVPSTLSLGYLPRRRTTIAGAPSAIASLRSASTRRAGGKPRRSSPAWDSRRRSGTSPSRR